MTAALDSEIRAALSEHGAEARRVLEPVVATRYDRKCWPTYGQYDWFCAQVLYSLLRARKPAQVLEVSTSSGYSSCITGLALKANGAGRLDTFELDAAVAAGAQRNFERLGVQGQIHLHVGDARKTSLGLAHLRDADILFLDSLHTAEFMQWFMDAFVVGAAPGALVHVHDVTPWSARLRSYGSPGRGLVLDARRWLYNRWVAGLPRSEEVLPTVHPPQAGVAGDKPSYNGIETMEAVLANELALLMPPGAYAFLNQLAPLVPEAEAQKFGGMSIGRQDRFGAPAEWNDAFWARAGDTAAALARWRASGRPLRPDFEPGSGA
ncbi:MAG TPA: class I SAM-dependent methyltransferase [bacterium]|jgi:predicted O-methyltransferase YrrM|nr:class I SAM-dependent methyltransferase [bacterium]